MRRLSLAVLTLFLSPICMPSGAQTIDTAILGTVTDHTGGGIPDATVVVTDTATGITKKAVTSPIGEFSITYLTPGTYNVTTSHDGFSTNEQTGIVLQINQQAKMNVILQIGTVQQTVKVEGVQPLLQSEDASLGVVVGQEQTESLPLNGRKFDDLASLTPGVVPADSDTHTSATGGSTISAFGAQSTWGQYNVDGVLEFNNRSPYVNIFPSIDAIQEFKIFAGNMEAEYGGSAGAISNVQLKSGSNSIHGDVFDYFRNTALDARNYFRPTTLPKQVLKQNQFGATLGGPIIKDKTFFFFSYEGLRSIEQTPGLTNVLTAAQKAGNFAGSSQITFKPTGWAYVNNNLTAAANSGAPAGTYFFDQTAANIATSYMPLPNTTQNGDNYASLTNANETQDQYLMRLDHKINEANQLAFHFIYEFRNFPQIGANPFFPYTGTFPMLNTAFQFVHTFSPTKVNELRLGYDFEHVKVLSTLTGTNFTAASIGINGFVQQNGQPWPANQQAFPVISISGLIGVGNSSAASNLDDSRTFQLIDNFTWSLGKHSLILGYEVRHLQDDATTDNDPYGYYTFSSTFTNNSSADYMLGLYQNLITPEGVPLTAARQWRDFAYVEDNWQATPNLTLNLGGRWDLWVPPHDNLPTSHTLNWSTGVPIEVPLSTPLWQVSHKNFSPRVGFAYSLPQKMVVRSAYGITWYGGKFDNINILQLNPPTDPSFTLFNNTNAPGYTLENPFGPGQTAANPIAGTYFPNITSLPYDLKHPNLYLQTWNLTVSKQFWNNVIDISYVGVKGTHQDTSLIQFNVGPPQPSLIKTVQQDRPYGNLYTQMRVVDFHGASAYNGLNVHFEHRISQGLNLTTAYSWSHVLDNQEGDTNSSYRNGTQTIAKQWATGGTDQRQALTIAFVYQTPKIVGGFAAERAILNGWGLNSIFSFVSGLPVFVTEANDTENNGNNYEYPDVVPGQSLHNLPGRSIAEWFNTAAFTAANGHYGNTRRDPVTGVPHDPVTLSLNRSFPLPFEGQHLDFRIEAFNILNDPQFSAPSGSYGSSAFGKITATSIDNRDLELVLKYFF
jgi:hypothetical protein